MGQKYKQLNKKQIHFIENQHMFFVATAGAEGKVNLSPKGADTFRVVSETEVIWLNLTGSGNETSAHVQENGRMTIMFCAFEGNPMILRLYGNAEVYHSRDSEYSSYIDMFPKLPGTRQIFKLSVDLVQASCGMSVPYFDFKEDRNLLNDWASKRGEEGIKGYWDEKNRTSIDGKETNILPE